MAEKITNYEDNIFFLLLLVKSLRDGLRLEIDSKYFGQKMVSDLFFIASVIDDIFKPLKSNIHLFKRQNYLKELKRLKKQFVDLIDDIADNKVPQASLFLSSADRLKELRKIYAKDILEIKSMLPKSSGEQGGEEEHIVSEEEFRVLLLPDEENT
jgi:hypothetical protein